MQRSGGLDVPAKFMCELLAFYTHDHSHMQPDSTGHTAHAQQPRVCHLVAQAFEEGGLQLRHEWLQAWASFANEEAQGVQDGRLDLPGKAVADDADEWPCSQNKQSGPVHLAMTVWTALFQSFCCHAADARDATVHQCVLHL